MRLAHQQELESLERDCRRMAEPLQRMAWQVLQQGISKYPVFVATRQPIGLGLPLFSAAEWGLSWDIRISHLEELVKKQLVLRENLQQFRQQYPDPRHHACVLLVPDQVLDARLAFVPYGNPGPPPVA